MAVLTLWLLVFAAFIVVLSGAALGLCVNSMNDIVVNMLLSDLFTSYTITTQCT